MKNNFMWAKNNVLMTLIIVVVMLLTCGLKVSAQSEGRLTKAEERMLRRLERDALRQSEIPLTPVKAPKKANKQKDNAVNDTQMQGITPKHKHGDWFFGLGGGFSQSLAENADATDFIFHQMPSIDMVLGHNFTPIFGFQLSGGITSQVSRCSEAASKAMPEVFGNGRYNFKFLSATASGTLNLTNAFFGYDPDRPVTWGLIVGAGVIQTFAFEDKLARWNVTPNAEKPYYPVNKDGGRYFVGHAGMQMGIRLNEPWDICVDLRLNGTDNKYNGASDGNSLDFYLDLMVNFVYHMKNGKQQLRRFRQPPKVPFVDPVLIDHTRDYQETVRYGESMYTEIPFYAGFYYLNGTTTKRVEQVAKFLQSHPLVNLNIVGHPDIIPDEDEEYHRVLAQKRAEAVREALVLNYHVDPTRLRTSIDDKALQSYKTVREWVPAVNFIMEDPGDEIPTIDKKE